MKFKFSLNAIFGLLLIIVFSGFTFSSLFLGISGYSGSPGDNGQTCYSCHGGILTPDTGRIFTNIPATGFVPSDTYAITVMLDDTLQTYFELTSENNAAKYGKFIANSNTMAGNGDRTIMSTFWLSSPSCTFNWVAPADNSIDSITFYTAITFNPNSETKTDNLKVLAYNSGLENSIISDSKIYAIAEIKSVFVQYYLNDKCFTEISVFDACGNKLGLLFSGNESSGLQEKVLKIPSGFYQGIYIVYVSFYSEQGRSEQLVKKILL